MFPRQLKLRHYLCEEKRIERLDRFKLADDQFIDEEVEPQMLSQTESMIDERNMHLPAEGNSSSCEFVTKTRFVDRFQESGSQGLVNRVS